MVRPANGTLTPALLLLLALPGPPVRRDSAAAPAPKAPKSGVLVLDDCDEQYKGKKTYGDNLSYIAADGTLVFRLSGFNNCDSRGSNHAIATDPARDCFWVAENEGHRIRKFDRRGRELLVIKEVPASAVAVDPTNGNLWVLVSRGTASGDGTAVFSPKGKQLATYNASGWDIAYDRMSKSFWVAGSKLTRIVAKTGKVAFTKDISTWSASSLAVHGATGKVWVTVRLHPGAAKSKNELLGFDPDGTRTHTIALGERNPFHVSIDQRTGTVWVTIRREAVQLYSLKGKKLAEHKFDVLAAQADLSGSDAWVVTPTEVLRVSPKGEVLKQVKHKSKTWQAWVIGF